MILLARNSSSLRQLVKHAGKTGKDTRGGHCAPFRDSNISPVSINKQKSPETPNKRKLI
jgi:hypothetical protein